MDVVNRLNNNPVNDTTMLISDLFNDLDEDIKSRSNRSLFG